METLIVVAQPRNQYCSGKKSRGPNRFGSPPSRGFKGINCRSFESSSVAHSFGSSQGPMPSKQSSPISIRPRRTSGGASFGECGEEFENWAGPAYSNSPPPSSLPIPKFSLRQKRSVSLDSPLPSFGIDVPPSSRSAPPSPTRDSFSSATENLRRILHLDVADD